MLLSGLCKQEGCRGLRLSVFPWSSCRKRLWEPHPPHNAPLKPKAGMCPLRHVCSHKLAFIHRDPYGLKHTHTIPDHNSQSLLNLTKTSHFSIHILSTSYCENVLPTVKREPQFCLLTAQTLWNILASRDKVACAIHCYVQHMRGEGTLEIRNYKWENEYKQQIRNDNEVL